MVPLCATHPFAAYLIWLQPVVAFELASGTSTAMYIGMRSFTIVKYSRFSAATTAEGLLMLGF